MHLSFNGGYWKVYTASYCTTPAWQRKIRIGLRIDDTNHKKKKKANRPRSPSLRLARTWTWMSEMLKWKCESDVTCGQVWWPILGIRALQLTHPKSTHTHREHTPGAVGSHLCCGTRGAVGGSVPCSRAPQSWYEGGECTHTQCALIQ